jgi:threonine synthase
MTHKTNVVYSPSLSAKWDCHIWLKLEMSNITGSHKDRESQLVVAECLKRGHTELGCATTGNYGLSLAYYAWLHGLHFHVWVMKSTPLDVVNVLRMFNAHIHSVDAPLAELVEVSSRALMQIGAMDANPGRCGLKLAAHKETAHEIQQQIPSLSKVVVPVNNGSLLLGIADGLAPDVKLIGVTSRSEGATAINDFCCAEGREQIVESVLNRQGQLVDVSGDEINMAQTLLHQEGIEAELSSASVMAALPYISCCEQEHICCVITGRREKPALFHQLKLERLELEHIEQQRRVLSL